MDERCAIPEIARKMYASQFSKQVEPSLKKRIIPQIAEGGATAKRYDAVMAKKALPKLLWDEIDPRFGDIQI